MWAGFWKLSNVADNAPPNEPWDRDSGRPEVDKTADHPYSAQCECMQCKADRAQKAGDLNDNDLVMGGGKLPPSKGARFKRKKPPLPRSNLDDVTMG